MPFAIYRPRVSTEAKREDKDVADKNASIPIVLVPGISGSSEELAGLVDSLQEIDPQSTIYVWQDPRINAPGSSSVAQKTVDELSTEIATAMLTIFPDGPFHLAGVSFGGPVARKTAEYLVTAGKEVSTCLVDCPSPLLSQVYLREKNVFATQDLISIISLGAKFSHFPTPTLDLSDEQISNWSALPITEQFKAIKASVLSHQDDEHLPPEAMGVFQGYMQLMRSNLASLLACETKPTCVLNDLFVLTTKPTRMKYNCDKKAGWDAFAKKISTKTLPGTHTSILEYKKTELAQAIYNHFSLHTIRKEAGKKLSVNGTHLSPPNSYPLSPRTSLSTSPLSTRFNLFSFSPPSSPTLSPLSPSASPPPSLVSESKTEAPASHKKSRSSRKRQRTEDNNSSEKQSSNTTRFWQTGTRRVTRKRDKSGMRVKIALTP